MQDYTENLQASYHAVLKRIRQLQGRLRAAGDSLSQRTIVDELTQLEQERLKIDNLFLESGAEMHATTDDERFAILASLEKRYPDVLRTHSTQVRDVQALLLYLRYFEEEFIGLFSERKLKLDVKYSVERDGFYHQFSQLSRRVANYCDEALRIQEGNYSKTYEQDMLKRMVEMRHAVVIDSNTFFGRVHRFAGELIDDLDGDGILCQNGESELTYSELDRETELRGVAVRDALQLLFDACDEILEYLDVPDFG
ncbi:MAG: hypothetical protein EA384_08695 [Spirochaetaceae bacterium]|nr:MAG: hypothetical protein EA384_08695 [Spirochaetaceae bacterium]